MAKVVNQRDAVHYIWGGDCHGWHFLKSPGLSIIKERVPSGRREVRHFHQHSQQFFYVLSGQATLEVEGRVVKLRPQEGCSIPPLAPHQLSNEGVEDLEFLLVSAPPSQEDRIEVKGPLK